MKKIFIIALTLFLISSSSLWSNDLCNFTMTQKGKYMASEINLQTDIRRLKALQIKFNDSDNAVDRYNYSAAMIDYIERMVVKMKDVNEIYYNPAILILTGEIPDRRTNNKNKK